MGWLQIKWQISSKIALVNVTQVLKEITPYLQGIHVLTDKWTLTSHEKKNG